MLYNRYRWDNNITSKQRIHLMLTLKNRYPKLKLYAYSGGALIVGFAGAMTFLVHNNTNLNQFAYIPVASDPLSINEDKDADQPTVPAVPAGVEQPVRTADEQSWPTTTTSDNTASSQPQVTEQAPSPSTEDTAEPTDPVIPVKPTEPEEEPTTPEDPETPAPDPTVPEDEGLIEDIVDILPLPVTVTLGGDSV